MKFSGKCNHKTQNLWKWSSSQKKTLLIKTKVSQINNSDNNANLSESFDYGDVLSGNDSSIGNNDKDNIETSTNTLFLICLIPT